MISNRFFNKLFKKLKNKFKIYQLPKLDRKFSKKFLEEVIDLQNRLNNLGININNNPKPPEHIFCRTFLGPNHLHLDLNPIGSGFNSKNKDKLVIEKTNTDNIYYSYIPELEDKDRQ